MEGSNIKSIIKWAFSLLVLVIVFLFFNWWGVIGYFAFIFLVAGYILYKKWGVYMMIIKYGSDSLHKLGGKYNDKNKNTNKRTIKKPNN